MHVHQICWYYIIFTPWEFFTLVLADGLSLEFERQQVSRTLLSILAVLNNIVAWMVSTAPPTSKSSSPFNNPLMTEPKAQITIGVFVPFMFHNFFNSRARSRYLIIIILFCVFYIFYFKTKDCSHRVFRHNCLNRTIKRHYYCLVNGV